MNDGDRRSIRLREYDYTQGGAYFVTICLGATDTALSKVDGGAVQLTAVGDIVEKAWFETTRKRDYVTLDEFVIMPNHFHVIVMISDPRRGMACHALSKIDGLGRFGAPTPRSLSSIIGGFKSASTRSVNLMRDTPGGILWQRNYYEHVVRNEVDLAEKRQYIRNNPLAWELDEYYAK